MNPERVSINERYRLYKVVLVLNRKLIVFMILLPTARGPRMRRIVVLISGGLYLSNGCRPALDRRMAVIHVSGQDEVLVEVGTTLGEGSGAGRRSRGSAGGEP